MWRVYGAGGSSGRRGRWSLGSPRSAPVRRGQGGGGWAGLPFQTRRPRVRLRPQPPRPASTAPEGRAGVPVREEDRERGHRGWHCRPTTGTSGWPQGNLWSLLEEAQSVGGGKGSGPGGAGCRCGGLTLPHRPLGEGGVRRSSPGGMGVAGLPGAEQECGQESVREAGPRGRGNGGRGNGGQASGRHWATVKGLRGGGPGHALPPLGSSHAGAARRPSGSSRARGLVPVPHGPGASHIPRLECASVQGCYRGRAEGRLGAAPEGWGRKWGEMAWTGGAGVGAPAQSPPPRGHCQAQEPWVACSVCAGAVGPGGAGGLPSLAPGRPLGPLGPLRVLTLPSPRSGQGLPSPCVARPRVARRGCWAGQVVLHQPAGPPVHPLGRSLSSSLGVP